MISSIFLASSSMPSWSPLLREWHGSKRTRAARPCRGRQKHAATSQKTARALTWRISAYAPRLPRVRFVCQLALYTESVSNSPECGTLQHRHRCVSMNPILRAYLR